MKQKKTEQKNRWQMKSMARLLSVQSNITKQLII